ncbi:MAG: SurA N-terminal domain-containing protein [Pseudomonadota bacterium]|nr:SurA N-terminal domain-containing protein [Pseudomonadota bacterium]
MLQKIRDNTQGTFSKVFLGFVIAVFGLFGLESLVGTFMGSTTTLKVNGAEISAVEIDALTNSKAQEFFAQLGEDADLSGFDEALFRESAVNELIQRELLLQSATRSNMTISSVSLDREIAQTPDFQIDGVFNAERASLLLRNAGYSPASYRASRARERMINQILAGYSATGFATPADMERLAALSHQKRSFRYLTLGLAGQTESIDVSDADVETWYQEHQDEFMREEQVTIEYVELNRNDMMAEVEITEEELQERYADEQALFQAQTERHAAHILFNAATEDEYEAALAEAESVKARIDNGEDFAALAAEFSDDTGSAQDGGDVGFTTGSNFVEPFEEALRELDVGAVSEPVRTEFGYHLIKLLDENETEVETFEQRRTALENDLRAQKAADLFIARSEELSNLAFEAVDLQEPAEALNLMIQRSEPFGRSGGVGIAALGSVINAAFSPEVLEEMLNSELIALDNSRSIVLRVVDHQEPQLRPLDEVRGEITVILQRERASEQVRSIGETIVSSMQSGSNIDGLLAAQNTTWTQVDAIERNVAGANAEITDKVFTMPRPEEGATLVQGHTLNDGSYIVVELQNVTDGTAADFRENEEGNLRNFISQQMAVNDFAGFMGNLEARADIEGRNALLPETFEEEF